MQIVIDIPNNVKAKIDDNINACDIDIYDCVMIAVKNGTPLPKHGRLIDAEHLKNVALLHNFHGNNKSIVPYSDRKGYRLRQREVDEAIINAPTIIKADKG